MNFQNVEFERSFGTHSQLIPSDVPEIVFAGRSNVGKSSAINKLLGRRSLARVSSVPGKTATINFFRLDNIRFVDLPGYGYAKVSHNEKQRWNNLINGYFAEDRDILLVLSLIDMRHPPTDYDQKMVDFLIEQELPFLCVLTKSDKLTPTQRRQRLEAIRTELPCGDQIKFVPFSSQTGEGVQELREIFEELTQEQTSEGDA